MTKPRSVSLRCPLLALCVLSASLAIAGAEPPAGVSPGSGTAANPPSDDVLRGPAVKKGDIESERPFTGGKREGGARLQTKPALEFASFAAAVGAMDLPEARKVELVTACEAFQDRAAAWEKSAAERRKKIYDARKRESSDEPPSAEFKKAISELDASLPKVVELQQQVYALLSEEEGAQLKKAYESELARRREEITKEVAAERKRKAEALKAAK